MAAKTYKTVYFHRIKLFVTTPNSSENGPEQQYLTKQEQYAKWSEILLTLKGKDWSFLSEGEKRSTRFTFLGGMDNFLNGDGSLITGKLAATRDPKGYERFDTTTSQSRATVGPGEDFYARTYFVLNPRTGIIVITRGEAAAPSVNEFAPFVSNVSKDEDYQRVFGTVTDLIKEDGLEILKNKDQIGSVYYDMEIPKSLPLDIVGLSEKDYDLLQDQAHIRIQVALVAKRTKKSSFSNVSAIADFFGNLLGNEKVKRVSANAKDEDEARMTPVMLRNNPLTKSEPFDYGPSLSEHEFEKRIQKRLLSIYESNLTDINNYLK